MFIIVMGVSGVGKTTIGTALAKDLGWSFADADEFHPPANIEKMSRGIPLNDDDRQPWLQAIRAYMIERMSRGESGVVTCSALKQRYRDVLQVNEQVKFVYLKGNYDLILKRMQARQHFMKPEMLKSQFEALEEPNEAVAVSIEKEIGEIVETVKRELRLGVN
ncbi:MAG: gluconokinase [Chloroflexi bacterium]|nr:gluconokinase [Chloroflexota bacterium]